MAQILTFSAPESRSTDPSHRNGGGETGEVIIFPGVRYERWNELHDEQTSRRGRQNERDVLDLAE
ncbi:hypothetical protein [Hyphomicrobium sp. D-2]|uniref:hypothetical protein n=1 Tax=Hyphomicrobium sp. D-2 TaxID=3041621 RepID=UPI002454A561|nr:hypothetical protein [Hyphomicrobium sp. D-2]MDH4981287.1 hypothetical protein [Hyphomicrobium sp. D-2]